MKFRAFISALAVVAGLIFIVGVGGFWGLTAQSPRALLSQTTRSAPTAAQFIPKQSPLMVSLLARPDRLWGLRQLLTHPNQRFQARREWASLKRTLADASGLDYDADIRPWLGDEVTVAVITTDLDQVPDNGAQPGYLLVLPSRNGDLAREAIHLFWQRRAIAGDDLIFEPIAGVTLIHNQPSPVPVPTNRRFVPSPPLASAMIGDRYVLLANHPDVLRQAIAAGQAPDVSLARDVTYRQMVKTLPHNRLGWVYGNLPSLIPWLGLAASDGSKTGMAPPGQGAQRFFLTLQATEEGIAAGTALTAAPGHTFPSHQPTLTQPVAALQWLPETVTLAAAGTDLGGLWQATQDSIGGYSPVQAALDRVPSLLTAGLGDEARDEEDYGADGFTPAWMTGEYALGLLPGTKPSWIFVAEYPGDDSRLARLNGLAQSQGLGIGQFPLAGRTVTAWTQLSVQPDPAGLRLQTEVVGVYTPVGSHEIFATSLEGLQAALQTPQQGSLRDMPTFTEQWRSLQSPNEGALYLDWPRLSPFLTEAWPWLRAIAPIIEPLTMHLGSVIVTSYGGDGLMEMGGVRVRLVEHS